MAKKLQILLMIFCLGIFIFPKQNSVFENNMSCCKTEKSQKEHCQNSKKMPCHDSRSKKKSCEGNCTNCNSCVSGIILAAEISKPAIIKVQQITISNKVENFYLQPYFSTLYKVIWQPPKIS